MTDLEFGRWNTPMQGSTRVLAMVKVIDVIRERYSLDRFDVSHRYAVLRRSLRRNQLPTRMNNARQYRLPSLHWLP